MADFDLDKYLKENEGSTPSKSSTESNTFDLDKYIQNNPIKQVVQQSTQSPQQFSKLQSAGIAAEKGLTGGLTGVAAGLGAGLGSLAGGGDFKSAFQEGLNERKNMEDAAHKANPITSNILELASSIPSLMVGGGALKSAGIAAPVAQGAILGGTTGVTNYLGQNADPTASGALESGAIGTGLGAAGAGIAKGAGALLNPVARKLGQAGQSLFGQGAQDAIKSDTETLANNIVNSIRQQKKSIGQAYEQILNANQDKSIDLNDFVNSLKQRADNFDTSLPDQARDKKAIMDLIQNVTEGPESKQVIGFKPGDINTTKQTVGFQPSGPTKTIPATPGAQDDLIGFGQRFVESQKQLGRQASFQIVPNEDNSLLTLVTKTEGENGPVAAAKTIPNEPGNEETPFSTPIKPITADIPTSQDIDPITGMVRQGGTTTPNVATAKTLRSNLGTLAYEKNLSNAGEDFGQETYRDLTQTLKDQIPGLGPTDDKFTALLSVARKLGIKGNDEDVVRVLSKMTSDNQGKQIIVNQALDSLDKVNPQVADQIRNQSANLDQKIDMIDQISNIGNFNVLNPKSLVIGLVKNAGGLRAAAGNIVGQVERTPIGNIVQKTAAMTPTAGTISPWSQEKAQNKAGVTNQSNTSPAQNVTRTASTLYNATNESLRNVADKLKSQAGMGPTADYLKKAIDNNDSAAKNRAIFLIMQNPNSRALVTEEK